MQSALKAVDGVDGVEVDYEISGSGVPALFIHGGFGGPGTTLVAQNRNDADLLPADKVMTISYDRRGAGRSEYNLSYYTVADLAADARALLAHLGIWSRKATSCMASSYSSPGIDARTGRGAEFTLIRFTFVKTVI